jgi:hypothetical protein
VSKVNNFKDLFIEDIKTELSDWDHALKSELKLDDVSSKKTKKHFDLGSWPTLAIQSHKFVSLRSQTSWKKASQTYIHIDLDKIESYLQDDLDSGVRVFFFYSDHFPPHAWEIIQKTLKKYPLSHELEVYLFGASKVDPAPGLKVILQDQMMSAGEVHLHGGHNVQELALLLTKFIDSLDQDVPYLAVYVDSHFFKNIAKIRALKLLSQKVLFESGLNRDIKIICLNSYREWTLFERYSNMLRNNTQVASAYIAGADVIQSSGYQVLFDLETNSIDPFHQDRSLRMARNTAHILGLESMLGMVEDAAYGSYHLENMSQAYAREAWVLMQKLIPLTPDERREMLEPHIEKVRTERLLRVKTRKDILAGINDYPNGCERLETRLSAPRFFRTSRDFEELRLKLESVPNLPIVQVIVSGDTASLSPRISFIKNYFELIGLQVIEERETVSPIENRILVLCSQDDHYTTLIEKFKNHQAISYFIAGKFHSQHFESIHSGQNVFDVLDKLVSKIVRNS